MFNTQQDQDSRRAAGLAVTSNHFREAIRERIPNPVRFGLYLVAASTPLLAISGEVFGVVSLRTVSAVVLFPVLAILAVLVIVKPAGIDRTARAGFAWGVAACAGYDLFRLHAVYVFHLWGDFFGRIGGWATGTGSDYLAGYLWRYLATEPASASSSSCRPPSSGCPAGPGGVWSGSRSRSPSAPCGQGWCSPTRSRRPGGRCSRSPRRRWRG